MLVRLYICSLDKFICRIYPLRQCCPEPPASQVIQHRDGGHSPPGHAPHLARRPGRARLCRRARPKAGLPRQRLNYHLKALEQCGLLECVEERRKGNCTERILRATAHSFVISPDALGALGPTPGSSPRSLQRLLRGRGRGPDDHRSLFARRTGASRAQATLHARHRCGDPLRLSRVPRGLCLRASRSRGRARREVSRRRVAPRPPLSRRGAGTSAGGRPAARCRRRSPSTPDVTPREQE